MAHTKPLVDVVVATFGRTEEPARLFQSLTLQQYQRIRTIIVDQNGDDRLLPILDTIPARIPSVRVLSAPGLSRARNAGLRSVLGDVIAFADDDCWYPPDLVSEVVTLLETHPKLHGVSVRLSDGSGNAATGRWDDDFGLVDRRNVWRRATSCTLFLRREFVAAVGEFDEDLGLGSGTAFGSGEETDYVLRGLARGMAIAYVPALAVFHPARRAADDWPAASVARSYGMGMGRVLRKHAYPSWFVWYHVGRAVGGALIALGEGRPREARFHWGIARGRLEGWAARRFEP